jgi:Transposase DDE domain group 1
LVLREIERRLRVAERLAACIADPRDPDRTVHRLAEIVRFRLLAIAAGYEDGNDATSLRTDPLFKMALERLPSGPALCSQSTISRLENQPDTRALLRMGRALVDLYCGSFRQVPRRIVLDVDDTFDAVHGTPQLRLFNAHYDEYGFQPMVVFDGEGRFVTALLRPAKRPSGVEIRAFLRRLPAPLGSGDPRALAEDRDPGARRRTLRLSRGARLVRGRARRLRSWPAVHQHITAARDDVGSAHRRPLRGRTERRQGAALQGVL